MKNMSKSLWHKPEMIVLVRSNPEESVLQNCKVSGANQPGYNNCAAGASANRCDAITGT